MTDPLDDDIDVIETDTQEYGPEVGDPDYWLAEDGDMVPEKDNYDTFSLEEGDYEMSAVELDRTLRSISARAGMAPAEDGGAVFFSGEDFCYVNVEDLDYEEGRADVTVRKGDVSELSEKPLESDDVSNGFFEKIVDEVEASDEELERQRNRLT